MPKRYLDVGAMDPTLGGDVKPQRKTERSHEENQERAYIAASRRADRSIEARVQSARMASEIHKRRTGKPFRITEEIVMKEEMYEEEEDDFPRSYRLLGPHMQTSSPEMNSRVETYLTNRVAMSQLLSASEKDWRENAINKAFAQTFPNVTPVAQSLSQRWSTPGFSVPTPQPPSGRMHNSVDSSFAPNFQSVNYGSSHMHHHNRSSSMSGGVSPIELNDTHQSPSVLTPTSGSNPHTPQLQPSPIFPSANQPAHNLMNFGTDGSPFTAELPPEAKMLMGGVDIHDPTNAVYNEPWNNALPSHMYSQYPELPKQDKMQDGQPDDSMYNLGSVDAMDWDGTTQPPANDESWEQFINDVPWTTDQQ